MNHPVPKPASLVCALIYAFAGMCAASVSVGATTARAQSTAATAPVVVQPGAPGKPSKTLPADAPATPPQRSPADVDFMQGMIMHHSQAVEMTALIASHTQNKGVSLLGARISSSQSDEMAFMKRWLHARGEATSMSMPGMPDMDMTGAPMPAMPGMLTAEQMEALCNARGAAFDHLFLTGMIQHHNGALTMVKALFDTAGAGQDADLFNFATDADNTQRAEIRIMQTMLQEKKLGDIMTQANKLTLAAAAIILSFGTGAVRAQKAAPVAPITQPPDAKAAAKPTPTDELDEFAAKPAPPLPAGMTGSDATDPRYTLKPGMYDAGEAAMGLKHLDFVKKPTPFRLDATSPDDPQVNKALGLLGVGDASKMPKGLKPVLAQLAYANSDFAFRGNYLFQGNFYGVSIYDIADPTKTKLLTTLVCPGGQGDVSVYGNLLFMSVEMTNGRLDCGTQGFPPEPAPAAGHEKERHLPVVQKDRFRGVRIFDISDIRNPKQVAAVQTCRGSHTHTLVTDPNDKANVYLYVSGTSFVRQSEELAGCSGDAPDKDPNTALFRIDVIKVPVAAPQQAAVVSSPRVFIDPRTGALNGLNNGGSHGKGEEKPADTNQCHDITVYSAIGLAAGACSGNGILLDIKDPVHPKRLDAVNDPNYSYWHSASFSNDGTKVVFTDEWGGGLGARCRPNDPIKWGADAIFNLSANKLSLASYYKLPAAQGDSENCVAHNGSLIPVPGRDIEVQSWYQGGISVMDFTDSAHPFEIAYFDRGPIDPTMLVLGGDWSAYWYNGHIYGSEIARGLDVFELTPSKFLTQNEIDAAKSVKVATLNVQNQEKIVWPAQWSVAKAYVDQLARSQALPADRVTMLQDTIHKAEGPGGNASRAKLKGMVAELESKADTASSADAARFRGLAEVLKHPRM